jgi:hypothetical protein
VNINPLHWSRNVHFIALGLASVAVAAFATITLGGSQSPELAAGCQLGQDSGGFLAASQQNYGDGPSAYQITVTNDSKSPLTVDGFNVTFQAFGSQVTSGTSNVRPALIGPGEHWYFTIDTDRSGVVVSQNTYLNSTCTVTAVITASGQITPSVVRMPDGEQVTQQSN